MAQKNDVTYIPVSTLWRMLTGMYFNDDDVLVVNDNDSLAIWRAEDSKAPLKYRGFIDFRDEMFHEYKEGQ